MQAVCLQLGNAGSLSASPGLLGSQTWLCELPDLNLAAQVSAASLSARQACTAVETSRVCALPPNLQQRPWLPWGSQLCIAGQRFQRPPYSFVQQLSISCWEPTTGLTSFNALSQTPLTPPYIPCKFTLHPLPNTKPVILRAMQDPPADCSAF